VTQVSSVSAVTVPPEPLRPREDPITGPPPRRRLAAKVGAAVLAAAAATGLALDEAGIWEPGDEQRLGLLLATAALALGSATGAALGEYRRGRAEARRDDIAFALTGAAFAIQDLTLIDVRDLGLAAYVLRRDRWRPWSKVLDRAYRLRAARRPAVSGITWRPGKGVIGLCVQTRDAVGQDVGADEAPWLQADRNDWALRVPDHVKSGLTYEEFLAVRGKYHVVVAVPILDDTRPGAEVRGCLALDGPAGSFATLWTQEVRDALAFSAATLRQYVL
jgi:hypothetical protein